MGSLRRLTFLKWTLCAALLTLLALTPRLWITDRAFPTIPATSSFPELPNGISIFLAVALAVAIVLAAISSKPRPFLIAIPLLGTALVLFDVNRLQPWFYQFMLMFVALATVQWNGGKVDDSDSALGICGVVLAFLYIWSGIQKANPVFASGVFPWLIGPIAKSLDNGSVELLKNAAYAVPVVEFLIGSMLLVPRTRSFALIGVALMHLSLLWLLGPFGHNYNSVVWPWNIAMILMAWIVFFRNDGAIFLPSMRPHLGKAIALLVVLMPLFNLFGKWDDYLSASLYSGRNISAWIFIGERSSRMFESKLSQAEMLRLQEAFDGYSFDATKWSLAELNVPLYPERRVFEVVATKLLHMGGSEGDVRLYVTEHRGILNDGPGEFREVPLR